MIIPLQTEYDNWAWVDDGITAFLAIQNASECNETLLVHTSKGERCATAQEVTAFVVEVLKRSALSPARAQMLVSYFYILENQFFKQAKPSLRKCLRLIKNWNCVAYHKQLSQDHEARLDAVCRMRDAHLQAETNIRTTLATAVNTLSTILIAKKIRKNQATPLFEITDSLITEANIVSELTKEAITSRRTSENLTAADINQINQDYETFKQKLQQAYNRDLPNNIYLDWIRKFLQSEGLLERI